MYKIAFILSLTFSFLLSSCAYSQDSTRYEYSIDINIEHAGWRETPLAADSSLYLGLKHLLQNGYCDSITYFLKSPRTLSFSADYRSGIHSQIKAYVLAKIILDDFCLSEILDLSVVFVSDKSVIDESESNWPIQYLVANDELVAKKLSHYLLASNYQFPKSKQNETSVFGTYNWIGRALIKNIPEEAINKLDIQRQEYLLQYR